MIAIAQLTPPSTARGQSLRTYRNHGRELSRRALAAGASQRVFRDGRTALRSISWPMAQGCQNPRSIEVRARPHSDLLRDVGETSYGLDLEVRCRQCDNCLRSRSRQWALRATSEVSRSARTWFVTLTLSPTQRWRARMEAVARFARTGGHPKYPSFESLPPAAQFQAIHAEISREITRYLKRIRKAIEPYRLRYLLVTERHKSGDPHYHLLVHELVRDTIKWSPLDSRWRFGFVKAKLVANSVKSARYVTKYLSKSALSRVRASQRYGSGPPCVHGDRSATFSEHSATSVSQRESSAPIKENENSFPNPFSMGGLGDLPQERRLRRVAIGLINEQIPQRGIQVGNSTELFPCNSADQSGHWLSKGPDYQSPPAGFPGERPARNAGLEWCSPDRTPERDSEMDAWPPPRKSLLVRMGPRRVRL